MPEDLRLQLLTFNLSTAHSCLQQCCTYAHPHDPQTADELKRAHSLVDTAYRRILERRHKEPHHVRSRQRQSPV